MKTTPKLFMLIGIIRNILFKIGILTENRGFLIQEADILLAEEDFIDIG